MYLDLNVFDAISAKQGLIVHLFVCFYSYAKLKMFQKLRVSNNANTYAFCIELSIVSIDI